METVGLLFDPDLLQTICLYWIKLKTKLQNPNVVLIKKNISSTDECEDDVEEEPSPGVTV